MTLDEKKEWYNLDFSWLKWKIFFDISNKNTQKENERKIIKYIKYWYIIYEYEEIIDDDDNLNNSNSLDELVY